MPIAVDPRTYTFDSQPRAEDRPRLEAAETLGRQIVEKSVEIWSQCWSSAKGHDEQAVILMTDWHLTELLDGVVVLVSAGAVEPARLQLRAAFESLVTLQYILQADTERRAYAWLVVKDVLDRIATWPMFDKSTNQGKKFDILAASEGHAFMDAQNAVVKAERLQKMLETEPRWKEAYDEYLRLKMTKFRKAHNRPAWHELFGGPEGGGLRPLAKHVGLGTQYEVIYRLWSRRVHGTDAVQRIRSDAGPKVVPLRDIDDLGVTMNYMTTFGLIAIRSMFAYYLPTRVAEYAKWYGEEIRAQWAQFSPSPEIVASAGLQT